MILIFIKFFHYLAIVFSGGVLVGGGLIQAVYTKANKIPDINIANILKILGYLGLFSLIILWITGILLSNIIYGGFTINSAFTLKIIFAGLLLGLSIFINLHVYSSNKKRLPPNKNILKISTMFSRFLIILILLCVAIAFN
jgi:hypothetical protein